jgi:hypothetical protein
MPLSLSHTDPTHSFDTLATLPRATPAEQGPYVLVLVVQPANTSPDAAEGSAAASLEPFVTPANAYPGIPVDAWPVVRDVCSSLRHRLGDEYNVRVVPIDGPAASNYAPRDFALDYPDLKIDRARHEVRTATRPVELTKGEFGLLAYLAENPGIVFTRRQLVDACRGGDRLVDDRSVDVQIFSLRKKLGDAATHIQTIRGVGYRFVPQPATTPFVPRPR